MLRAVTQRVYSHMSRDAHAADYGRVSFAMPSSALVARLRAV